MVNVTDSNTITSIVQTYDPILNNVSRPLNAYESFIVTKEVTILSDGFYNISGGPNSARANCVSTIKVFHNGKKINASNNSLSAFARAGDKVTINMNCYNTSSDYLAGFEYRI